MIFVDTCKQIRDLLFSLSVGFHFFFPVTQINCAGSSFTKVNQNSDAKLAKAYNLTVADLPCNDFERRQHSQQLSYNIRKVPSEAFRSQLRWPHNLAACFKFHTLAFVSRPSLWINCHRENKLRVCRQVQPRSLCIPNSPCPSPFFCPPPSPAIISWDVALATGGIFNAQCVVY